jgi:hypothetical protein
VSVGGKSRGPVGFTRRKRPFELTLPSEGLKNYVPWLLSSRIRNDGSIADMRQGRRRIRDGYIADRRQGKRRRDPTRIRDGTISGKRQRRSSVTRSRGAGRGRSSHLWVLLLSMLGLLLLQCSCCCRRHPFPSFSFGSQRICRSQPKPTPR